MTTFPNSPRLVKGGIVTMDPDTPAVQSIIALQYNPDSLTRSLQIQALPGGQDCVRVDALRLRRPVLENSSESWETSQNWFSIGGQPGNA